MAVVAAPLSLSLPDSLPNELWQIIFGWCTLWDMKSLGRLNTRFWGIYRIVRLSFFPAMREVEGLKPLKNETIYNNTGRHYFAVFDGYHSGPEHVSTTTTIGVLRSPDDYYVRLWGLTNAMSGMLVFVADSYYHHTETFVHTELPVPFFIARGIGLSRWSLKSGPEERICLLEQSLASLEPDRSARMSRPAYLDAADRMRSLLSLCPKKRVLTQDEYTEALAKKVKQSEP